MSEGTVVVYFSTDGAPLYAHEQATLESVARSIAGIKRWEFGGCYDRARHRGPLFFVPAETLLRGEALGLGIRNESDFFGGVVPHSLARTKAITHGLVSSQASRATGWP